MPELLNTASARPAVPDHVSSAEALVAAPDQPPHRSKWQLDYVDGMRAIAALVVVLNHAFAQVWKGGQVAPAYGLGALAYFMVLGHLAVAVFIVISGFCLMLPVLRHDGCLAGGPLAFYKRRARRILPPYYAAVALSLLLIWTVIGQPTGTLWDVPIVIRPQDFISHAILTQNVFGTGRINYVLWSIATEWQIYLLFPLLVWSWRTRGPAFTVGFVLTAGYAATLVAMGTRVGRAQPHFIGLFTLGMLAASLCFGKQSDGVTRVRRALASPLAAIAVSSLIAGLLVSWGWEEATRHFAVLDAPVGALTLMILVIASTPGNDNSVRAALSWGPLANLGTFSYSVYLIHAPLLQVVWQYVLQPMQLSREGEFGVLLLAGLPAILSLAYLFHIAAERPFLVRTPSAPGRRPQQAMAVLS